MRFVTIDASVPTRAAAEVFRTLADYARYPQLTPSSGTSRCGRTRAVT